MVNRNEPQSGWKFFPCCSNAMAWEAEVRSLYHTEVHMGRSRCTSVSKTLHVKSPLIRIEIFRSCFLWTIVLFTDVLTNGEIEALTRDFFLTPEIALFRQARPDTSQECFLWGTFYQQSVPFIALASSVKFTNPGLQKHDFQRQLWKHFGMTVKGGFMALRLRTYHYNSKYFKSLIMIIRGGIVNALYNF